MNPTTDSNSIFQTELLENREILRAIIEWSSTHPYLQHLPNVTDGWQRWAQLDIFFYLSSKSLKLFVKQKVYVGSY